MTESVSGRSGREGDEREGMADEGAAVVRHEEDLHVGVETQEVGAVNVRKHVEHEHVSERVPRSIEHVDDVERRAADEGDSGEVEVLPDGSVSIPILEEELVIQKRVVVRERIVIRKRTETLHEQVDATVRKERVDVERIDEG